MSPVSPYTVPAEPPARAENSTYAAITAVVAANLVLVCYIILSVREDNRGRKPQPPEKARPESKKDK